MGLSRFTETLQTRYRDRPPAEAALPDTDGYPTEGDSAHYWILHEPVGMRTNA